jgi:hypothetical protein
MTTVTFKTVKTKSTEPKTKRQIFFAKRCHNDILIWAILSKQSEKNADEPRDDILCISTVVGWGGCGRG